MARPRSEEVDRRILAAAREIVEERGYDALSIHAVARRAGVGHPAVYRRFPDKNALAMALSVAASVPAQAPDTGSFAGDLAVAEEALVASLLAAPRRVVGPQLGTMIADPAVSQRMRADLMDAADQLLAPVWVRAVERDEVRADLDGTAALQAYSYVIVVNIWVMHRDPEGPWRTQNREVFLRGVTTSGSDRG